MFYYGKATKNVLFDFQRAKIIYCIKVSFFVEVFISYFWSWHFSMIFYFNHNFTSKLFFIILKLILFSFIYIKTYFSQSFNIKSSTKVRVKFRKAGFISSSCLSEWRRTIYPCNFSVLLNYHHIITIISQSRLWFSCWFGVLGTTLTISCLWYSWWFGSMSIFLFSNIFLSWFVCILLPITKFSGNIRNTGFVVLSCLP